MDLYFLGTGAGMPSKERNVTSIALRLFEERGSFWLFDCGEGTQHQILRSPIKVSKLEKLFITHLHGDHIFGLPGLLSSRSYQGGESKLEIYGPHGLRAFIETSLSVSQSHLEYELECHEFSQDGVLLDDGQFRVAIKKLDHRIDSYGYRIEEANTAGKLQSELLLQAGIEPGPIYRRLKAGEDVVLEDGTVLHSKTYVGPELPGRVVTILGDTRVCAAAVELSRDADVLVHEATFASDLAEMAHRYHHCTTVQAAQTASDAGAGKLVMTHFSSRYQEELMGTLLEEARRIHPESYLAEDYLTFYIPRKQ